MLNVCPTSPRSSFLTAPPLENFGDCTLARNGLVLVCMWWGDPTDVPVAQAQNLPVMQGARF